MRFRSSVFAFFASTLALVAIGCGGGDAGADSGTPGNDTGPADGGGGDAGDVCGGASDGTPCGTGLICLAGSCETSVCGDGFVDTGEACDDGNSVAFDGCEPGSCTFTCSADTDCDDGAVCNGSETCSATHVCAVGTPATDGAACTLDAGGAGVCHAASCVAAGCGNGVVDAGEDCDDMNSVEGDGCDNDCLFSCAEDIDCSDGNVCNGSETCTVATHACAAGTTMDCADTSACTMDSCDPIDGCHNPLIDADGDGHAATTLGACGDDCDDTRADVYTGAEELCDSVDNNCNGDVDEVAPTWYVDCDDDGYAATTTSSRTGCSEPPASATGCGGGWTTVRPISTTTTDCNDNNATVHPGQTLYFTTPVPGTGGYDYDCSGDAARQYGCGPSGGGCGSTCSSGYQPYNSTSNPNGCQFICFSGRCYVNDYPDCGTSAAYDSCADLGTLCLAHASTVVQACH